jgi:hypothetical protein
MARPCLWRTNLAKKISQGCNVHVISFFFYLKVWKKANSRQPCRLPEPDSLSRGVVFRLRISPRIRSKSRNGSNGSVMDLCRTDLCKNLGKFGSLPYPFKKILSKTLLIISFYWSTFSPLLIPYSMQEKSSNKFCVWWLLERVLLVTAGFL